MERFGWRFKLEEPGLGRLLAIGYGVATPSSCQKQQRKAMGDIAVGIVDRVPPRPPRGSRMDQVALVGAA
jgi:hypothetical protein